MNNQVQPQEGSFNAAFARLEAIAQKLSNQKDLDIDGLLPDVEAAVKCRQICEERLTAVDTALAQMFGQEPCAKGEGA